MEKWDGRCVWGGKDGLSKFSSEEPEVKLQKRAKLGQERASIRAEKMLKKLSESNTNLEGARKKSGKGEQQNNALKLTERVCHGSCEAHERMPALALQLNADVRLLVGMLIENFIFVIRYDLYQNNTVFVVCDGVLDLQFVKLVLDIFAKSKEVNLV